MSSVLKKISNHKFSDEEKEIILDSNFNDMKDILKDAGYIKYKKDLTNPMFKMYQLVASNATEEEKNNFVLKESIKYKKYYFNFAVDLIHKLGKCYYNFFTYEASESFDKLFNKDLSINDFLVQLDNIQSLENIGVIINIKNKHSLLTIQNEVLNYFMEDAENEIRAFDDGYGFEEPEIDDFEDEQEYIEALKEHNNTLDYVRDLIKSSNILD
nr:hypothetical protein [uncultured Sulfurimonas sp.]